MNIQDSIKNIILNNNYWFKEHVLNYEIVEKNIIDKLLEDQTLKLEINKIYNEIVTEKLKKIQDLLDLPQPKQRTEEWYKIRNDMLTASDLGKIIKDKKVGTKNSIILKKCGYKSDVKLTGKALTWGVKYEPVANDIYCLRKNIKVYEFGLISHPTIEKFGASPDGISEDLVMLEIKCPFSREINGSIPEDYYAQIQGQLEVCDLDVCDYLECKFVEISRQEYDLNKENEKGVIIDAYDKKENINKYYYANIYCEGVILDEWIRETTNLIIMDDNLEYNNIFYWKCETYSCQPVYRNKEWFNNIRDKLDSFWKDVNNYRENGYESILPKKRIQQVTSNLKMDEFVDLKKNNLFKDDED